MLDSASWVSSSLIASSTTDLSSDWQLPEAARGIPSAQSMRKDELPDSALKRVAPIAAHAFTAGNTCAARMSKRTDWVE